MRRSATLAVILLCPLLAGCPDKVPGLKQLTELSGLSSSDEQKIAAVLADVHRGMESRQIYKVLSHVSPRYHDAEDRDYEDMKAYLSRLFKGYRKINIHRAKPRIVVQGDTARVVETFGTIAEPLGGASAINVQGQVTVHLEKADDTWRILEWSAVH